MSVVMATSKACVFNVDSTARYCAARADGSGVLHGSTAAHCHHFRKKELLRESSQQKSLLIVL